MAAVNGTPLAQGAGTADTLALANVNPGGTGIAVAIATRMSGGGNDATPTITDSVDGATGWTSIGVSRIPLYSYNFAIRAWWKAGWSGNRTVTIDGDNSIYSVQASVHHATAVNPTTPIGGLWTTTASIGDGSETGTLSAAPGTNDVTLAVVATDSSNNPASTWGGSYSTLLNRAAGATGGAGYSVGLRGTGSTSTSVDITDAYTGAGSLYGALGLAFVLVDDGGGGGGSSQQAPRLIVPGGGVGSAGLIVPGLVAVHRSVF